MTMSEKKKPLSFSDFAADDSSLIDDNLDQDLDQDTDDELEDQDQKEPKKVDKKQSKVVKTDLADHDTDSDDDLESLDKDKVKPKVDLKDKLKKVEPELDNTDDGDPEEATKFFEEVEKLTGNTVEVDYGDVSPLSPQGVALREKAIKELALDSFLEEVESKFPQAYKALQHAYAGGDITELFTQTTGRDYTRVELKEGDEVLSKQILGEYYKSKGVKSETKIAKLIEADEDSEGGIVKEAQTALAELKEEQEAATAKLLDKQKNAAAEQKKKDQILVAAVDEVLESKKLGSFRIMDRQDAVEFKKFVLGSVRKSADGNYELATPINTATLEQQLQFAYFQFKKGDLTKIIQQKATTENAKKLSLKFQSEQQKSKKTTEQENKTGFTLKDFMG